ncbi:hypothetical protein TB2_043202 [Malus domestica]|uniref:BRI1 kinase inhibitor 1 n=1 Tax=Malus domestica TaxID=3750 RepID=A0A498JEC4_MALDO|nr:hypothetical protein DVH24_020744 [Malus domestica]
MATHQLEKTKEIALDTLSRHEEERLKQLPKTAPASPPSSSSSPSHEFSFTISLHTSSSSTSNPNHQSKSKTSTTPPSFAIDLSPADEIFFHGHLLPLQFLSHLPVSPRSSTNSLDSFTLPLKELVEDQKPTRETATTNAENCIRNRNILNKKNNSCSSIDKRIPRQGSKHETRGRTKPKSFSIFGLPRWRKECENSEKEENNKEMKNKRKVRFDVSHILKRYVRMVRPLLLFRGRREKGQFRRQPYSFSGNLSMLNKHELRGRRGQFSAPASMRTSPTNSGHLVATAATNVPCSSSDSTMEELQAAIQAAIAHCKNSIATEEKPKC